MGSSTTSLQSVVDLMATMGSLSVAQAAGGYSQLTWLAIANDVVDDLVSQRFNWKWNSFKLPPFYTNSYQSDYATISLKTIGWLENAMWTDINNTCLPKPRFALEAVRELQPTSWAASPPSAVCWMRNSVLEQGVWPGNSVVYTAPLGVAPQPQNSPTNILDPDGNILVLTNYGTTAATGTEPVATPIAPATTVVPGQTVVDGTCIWTVADPYAQGFRITPLPPAQGVIYKIDVVGQSNPPSFTSLSQMIDPIPDDYANTFRNGVYVYCHKYSPDPMHKRDFPMMQRLWLGAIEEALKQGDREQEGAGFVVSKPAMAEMWGQDVGPANPYGSGWPGMWR